MIPFYSNQHLVFCTADEKTPKLDVTLETVKGDNTICFNLSLCPFSLTLNHQGIFDYKTEMSLVIYVADVALSFPLLSFGLLSTTSFEFTTNEKSKN